MPIASGQQVVIKEAFERLQMTPDEIALDQNLEIETVKLVLMATSGKFRRLAKKEGEGESVLNFSETQHEKALERIGDLIDSECEGIALRAAIYIRDDAKGRLDSINGAKGLQFNVINFNQMMVAANEAMKKALESPQPEMKDVVNV